MDGRNHFLSLCIFGILGAHFTAQAQTIRVDRVKGNKAIVEILSGGLTSGQNYDLSAGTIKEDNGEEKGRAAGSSKGSRTYLIGVAGSVTSLTTSVGGSSTSSSGFGVTGRFGWNLGATEYGFLGAFSSASSAGVNSTALLGGGFFEFNIIPNRNNTELVAGVGSEAGLGSSQASSSSSSVSTWYVYPSGFVKWFLFKNTTCIRGDLGLHYQTYQSSPAMTITGLDGRFALAHYF